MRVTYARNPLETKVEIDERDRQILRLKLVIEDYEDRLGSVALCFEDERPDLAGVRGEVAWDAWLGDKFDAKINKRLELLEGELCDIHSGDCTCQPCSCTKCWAESLLEVDTIPGLGKHQAANIFSAFAATPIPSPHEVIAKLENYRPVRCEAWLKFPQEDFDKWVPRWTEQARQAAEWLRDYTEQHFPVG